MLQVIGMLLLSLFRLTEPVALGYVLLAGIGGGFGQQSFFQLWSGGLSHAAAQHRSGPDVRCRPDRAWLLEPVRPDVNQERILPLAWILTGFVAFSGLIGFVFAPRNEGKTPEQIQRERHGSPESSGPRRFRGLVEVPTAVSKGGPTRAHATGASQAALRASSESTRRVA